MPAIDPFVQFSVPCFYHFTDRRNLTFIRQRGGLYSLAALRKMHIVIPAPGGNDLSHDLDRNRGLDRYVHLCFRQKHPMEYVAHKEGRIGETIYLQIHPDVRNFDGVMFSADVSNKSGVDVVCLADAFNLIDFPVLYTRMHWRDPEVQKRLRQTEKYELLIPNHVPMSLIRNLPNG